MTKPKGNDEMLAEVGNAKQVTKYLDANEFSLEVEQERVEAEVPSQDEPGTEQPERPPADEDQGHR